MREAAEPIWAAQREHPFVLGMADGTLPPDRFAFFLKQDCLFIPAYARALALAAGRAPWIDVSVRLAENATALLAAELGLNRDLASEFGVSPEELVAERPTRTTRAYIDFLLRVAAVEDFAQVTAAFLPCFWGYYDVFQTLARRARSPNHHYARWIEAYASPTSGAKVAWFREITDRAAEEAGLWTSARLIEAFIVSSELELAFWQMAWDGK